MLFNRTWCIEYFDTIGSLFSTGSFFESALDHLMLFSSEFRYRIKYSVVCPISDYLEWY